jgi:hypothetical protein
MKKRIVVIDDDFNYQDEIQEILNEYDVIFINDYEKGVELCKTAAPDLILLGINQKISYVPINAHIALKKDISLRKVPIIGLYPPSNRPRIEKDSQDGIEFSLVKQSNSKFFNTKISEILTNAKLQKDYEDTRLKTHIHVDVINKTVLRITFKSGLKFVLPEVKNIFNANYINSIYNKDICIDIRDFPNLSKEEINVIERIVLIFGKKRISIIVGKHMGVIISLSDLENNADLFLTIDDYLAFLKNPETENE